MKYKKILAMLLSLFIAAGILSGCNNSSTENTSSETTNNSSEESDNSVSSSVIASEASLLRTDMFTDRDLEIGYDTATATAVKLNGSSAEISGSGAVAEGNTVTISKEGTYIISGTLTDGQIIIDADETAKIQIVLDNADISNSTDAAISIKQADKVVITLASNSENKLSTTSEFTHPDDSNTDAVIFSKTDLTINGNGTLNVVTEYGNGITSKDDLAITSGTYSITASGHGLEGKDSVRIASGIFTLTTGKDGIHSENKDDAEKGFIYIADGTFTIDADYDAIDGKYYVDIADGDFNITTGGGYSASTKKHIDNMFRGGFSQSSDNTSSDTTASTKGIKSDGNVTISTGTFTIDSCDDSIHSNSNIVITDGTFTIASGDDGIHTDLNVDIEGGNIEIYESYEGIEGQNIDIKGGNIKVTSSDDGLNAAGESDQSSMGGRPGENSFAADENCYICISGGKIIISAAGDGIDSNGSLSVSGGETYVNGPTDSANGSLDYTSSGEITGGIILCAGSNGMAQNFSSATQGSILATTQSYQTGDVTLKDEDGNIILSYTPLKQYNCVVISTPDIEKGNTYTLVMGSETQTITMSSIIYGNQSGFAGGGMGGGKGGNMGGKAPDGMQAPDGDMQRPDDRPQPPEGDMQRPDMNTDGQSSATPSTTDSTVSMA